MKNTASLANIYIYIKLFKSYILDSSAGAAVHIKSMNS